MGERWSKELVGGIVGSPANPVLGENGRKMRAYARKFAKDEEAKMSYYAPVSTPSGEVSLITFAARTCLPLFRKYIQEIQEVRRKGERGRVV